MELDLIASCLGNRDAWSFSRKHLEESDFTPEGKIVFDAISVYYTKDVNAQSADRSLVLSAIKRKLSNAKHDELFARYFENLPKDVSDVNVLSEVVGLKREKVAYELQSALAGRKDEESIRHLIDKWQGLEDPHVLLESEDREAHTGWALRDLVEQHFDESKLIKLAPKILNDRCGGGAKPGNHILVFAPTEMGKTLFAVNLAAGFIKQGLSVLYIGNEDPVADINMRLVTRLTGNPRHEVMGDIDGHDKEARKRGYGLFTIVGLSPGDFIEIRELVEEYKPKVLILDQLRNLATGGENRTTELERAATDARNLAKSKNIVVVSLTQAADSASGRQRLNRGDVDSSNVGIPGQVDLMIGIGANEQMEEMGTRCISFPKNKLSGNHTPFNARFFPDISKVEEL